MARAVERYQQIFGVQTYRSEGKRLRAGDEIPCRDEPHGRRLCERVSGRIVGAVLYSRRVDTQTEDSDDPVILHFVGQVPEEVRDSVVPY